MIEVDSYVFDVLMRDILGHDKQPSALAVFLFLYAQAARQRSRASRQMRLRNASARSMLSLNS